MVVEMTKVTSTVGVKNQPTLIHTVRRSELNPQIKFIFDRNLPTFRDEMVDWKSLASDVYWLEYFVREFVIPAIKSFNFTENFLIIGVPAACRTLGEEAQKQWAHLDPNFGPGSHPLVTIRDKEKTKGTLTFETKNYIGGHFVKGRNILLIDDVVTTGDSMNITIEKIRATGGKVIGVLALTDRNEMHGSKELKSVPQVMAERGFAFKAITNMVDILPELVRREKPNIEMLKELRAHYEANGTPEMKSVMREIFSKSIPTE